jgi:hypothetical protein
MVAGLADAPSAVPVRFEGSGRGLRQQKSIQQVIMESRLHAGYQDQDLTGGTRSHWIVFTGGSKLWWGTGGGKRILRMSFIWGCLVNSRFEGEKVQG